MQACLLPTERPAVIGSRTAGQRQPAASPGALLSACQQARSWLLGRLPTAPFSRPLRFRTSAESHSFPARRQPGLPPPAHLGSVRSVTLRLSFWNHQRLAARRPRHHMEALRSEREREWVVIAQEGARELLGEQGTSLAKACCAGGQRTSWPWTTRRPAAWRFPSRPGLHAQGQAVCLDCVPAAKSVFES